jgi:ribonuclease HI
MKIFIDGSTTDQSKTVHKKELRRGGIGIYHPETNLRVAEPFPLENPTNNRCEFWACIKALEWVLTQKKPDIIFIYTDSQLLINSMTKWVSGWKKRGWKKWNGQVIKNVELVQKLDKLLLRLPNTKFVKVKAHQKKPKDPSKLFEWRGNNIADALAKKGRRIAEMA